MTAEILVEVAFGWLVSRLSSKRKRVLTVPITIVDHREDGSWAFFSGNYFTKVKIDRLEEAIESDMTVKELKDLPPGFSALRKNADSPWVRSKASQRKAHR